MHKYVYNPTKYFFYHGLVTFNIKKYLEICQIFLMIPFTFPKPVSWFEENKFYSWPEPREVFLAIVFDHKNNNYVSIIYIKMKKIYFCGIESFFHVAE